jgi:hypothetical protein
MELLILLIDLVAAPYSLPEPITLDLASRRLVGDLEGNMQLPISSSPSSLDF